MVSRFFSILLLSLLYLINHQTVCISVTVTPSVSTINQVTVYQWVITGLTIPISTITLQVPTIATINVTGSTALLTSSGNTYGGSYTFSGNNILVSIQSADQNNQSITLKTTNIKNPPYSTRGDAKVTQNSNTKVFPISYNKGLINNCALSFAGVTDQVVSNASVDFKTTNPISANKTVFRVYYGTIIGTYTASGSKIVDNNNITCTNTINGVPSGVTVLAKYAVGSTYFDCEFNNLNISALSTIKLQLFSVRNPPYKNNYFSQTFTIQSMDGINSYDGSSSCTFNDVTIDIYQAVFSQSVYPINSQIANASVDTLQLLNKFFNPNDTIIVEHNSINFTTVGPYISLNRQTVPFIQYDVQSGTSITSIVTKNIFYTPLNQNAKIKLTLNNFVVQVPFSATPANITFRFFKNSGAANVELQFLNIFATLKPTPINFNPGSIAVTATSRSISDKTSYTYRISISQSLGTTAFFLLYLPLQLNINQFTNTSICTIATVSTGVMAPACNVYDAINKIIQINVNSTSGLAAPQTINITIGDIINPDNPDRSYIFGAQTYYKQGDYSSKVELGSSIFLYTYIQRSMNVQTTNINYYVGQFPSLLTIMYTPVVKLPTGLLIIFNFLPALTSISYKNTSVNGNYTVYSTSTSGQQISLTLTNEIAAQSLMIFNLQFRAPSSVSNYDALGIQVKTTAGVIYQKTTTNISIAVSDPASEIFSITPLSKITGVVTSYTINFFTNVYHPPIFYLLIQFPSDVSINFTSCFCTLPCTGIINNSSGSTQQIMLNITKQTNANTYSITINNTRNPRTLGTSGSFMLTTFTNYTNGNMIISGSTSILITTPNIAYANFDRNKSYYKMNTQPVTISSNFTNDLKLDDYIQVRFDYRTYGLASTGSLGVVCSGSYTCSYDAMQSTLFTTVIKVVPQDNSSLIDPITFSIQGLNSSSTTFPMQTFEVTIRSYDVLNRQIDEGKFNYFLSCTSSQALINQNCKTCNQTLKICYDCYFGFYQLNGTCVPDCPSASGYRAYASNTTCQLCKNNCSTCISLTQCLTCITNYYLYQDSTCRITCDNTGGVYVYTTQTGQKMCLKCFSPSCVTCTDGGSMNCTDCGNSFKQGSGIQGRCIQQCDLTTNYEKNLTGQCLPCDQKCNRCKGPTNNDCQACRPGYFNVSNSCLDSCPVNSVGLLNNTCGCQGNCSTCQLISTRCLSCINASMLLYNYQCISQCPSSSYQYIDKCFDCSQGCLSCTQTACIQCLPGYSVYENKCYTQCNNVGDRFASVNGTCIQCPVGCDFCDATLKCSICLANYTLVNGSICQRTCQILNNCQKPNPVPQKILPIPGMIACSVWLAILIIFKLFIIRSMYLPYSYIFGGCLAELTIIFVTVSKMNSTIQALLLTESRLLQTVNTNVTTPLPYQYGILGILATTIVLNYIANAVYVYLFCKYLRKYIPDRQIDKISNYLVVVIGTLTNFRFSLMAYSKLFPKPNIIVQNQSKLTPIHYMCIGSIFTSILPLTAAGILIYNEIALTDLFMLGVDLLIIQLISLGITIWIVSVDKPVQYFQGARKYKKQEVNFTNEAFNDKDNILNQSKGKIMNQPSNFQNSIVHVQDINEDINIQVKNYNPKSDNQNQPLPRVPMRYSNVNATKISIKPNNSDIQVSSNEPYQKNDLGQKTLRNTKKKPQTTAKNKKQQTKVANDGGIRSKVRQSTKNYSKEKSNKKIKVDEMNIKFKESSDKKEVNDQSQIYDDSIEANMSIIDKAKSDIIQRQKKALKPQTQRSSGIIPVTMKKKGSIGMFESEKGSSQIDEIDFQSLIQTKMIDKTKDRNLSSVKKQQTQQVQQISPSWFNEQNQRFDFEQSSQN